MKNLSILELAKAMQIITINSSVDIFEDFLSFSIPQLATEMPAER